MFRKQHKTTDTCIINCDLIHWSLLYWQYCKPSLIV